MDSKWANIIPIAPERSCSDNRDMINKLIKQKLQYFKHGYVQATCQRDPEVYATCHDPKIYPHTKFGIPISNYIKACSGLVLARLAETRGQCHSDQEPVGDSPGGLQSKRPQVKTSPSQNVPELVKASPKIGQNVPMVKNVGQNVPKMIFNLYFMLF